MRDPDCGGEYVEGIWNGCGCEDCMQAEDEDDGEWREGECDHCFGEPVDGPLGTVVCACSIGQGAERDEDCHCGPVADERVGMPCRRCYPTTA
jgi:hypothetical protein